MRHDQPSPSELAKLFDLEGVKVGRLFWAVRPANCVKIGDEAGCIHGEGRTKYRECMINGCYYKTHVIIWTIIHGRWPSPNMVIAHHPDTDGLNNHPNNLCEVSTRINSQEKRHQHTWKSSIYQGVSWHNRDLRWDAHIKLNGHQMSLGYFTDEMLAARTYDAAALLAFGEWANTNTKVHGWTYEPVELSACIIPKIECARGDVVHNEVRWKLGRT